ncbi:MAG: endopeptidase La [Sediminibacterium sp. Gen4]|jgi:ATP-dependent Lon protease|uniref:endopeptidase La n=1 Tax=unclassified Sediminibacterium TaxID=2635961 RepID=UPI0015BDC483|nr:MULTISPECIES: endopeptidase La [unclassified Sediminibacterium]MBW0162680.1 endopeptidase La [Sediminibacterium sp.]MBW0165661.1 endopeptidase La [Sediminibacterium sp.]NWK66810.1 endopeptidase La [Sediminibacterium sp. Gen4]
MLKEKLFFRAEDETDFMPIIPINETDGEFDKDTVIPETLPILPLRNTVLFPGVVLPITVGRDKSIKAVNEAYKSDKLIGVVAQKDANIEDPEPKDLCAIGTIAKIIKLIKMPDGGTTIIIQGKKRFELLKMDSEDPYFRASIRMLADDELPSHEDFDAIVSSIKDLATQIIQLSPNLPTEASIILKNIENPSFLINFVSSNLNSELAEKQGLLEINDIHQRAEKLIHILQRELQFAELKDKVTNKTRTEIDKQQRDYFLQQQLKSIKEELGGDTNEREIAEMKKKAEGKKWPDAAKTLFKSGIEKLERMHPSTPDYSVVYNHLDLMLDLPWNEHTDDNYDLKNAQKVLDIDHYGMTKIKSRILEYLAVLKLKGDMKSPILCFLGPPGIGKTSLGRSIAHAIGRKYVRLSLGGMHDESEIRGHRKTYIGAMPGRILQNIRKCKSSNPVMILDEIDKIGNDFRGDPSSALLEVLDPEQNNTFYDNYLELEYDLSKVLFIATANNLQNIQPALRDRLEIIDLSGYAVEEKVEIAKRHLLPKQKEAHGLAKVNIKINDKVLEKVIENYTRESGVRELDRQLAALMRYQAKELAIKNKVKSTLTLQDVEKILGQARYSNEIYKTANMPGVAVGLAWTYVGGDILFIETILGEGKGELKLTGNLGNVMKESASTALSYLQANARKYGIDPEDFSKKAIHIHVPEGAVPKDGPSAGITMLTSLASAFTGRKVKPYLAMTGEITLRGQVLPVGGIKEKVLAAKRSGLKEIILCWQNEKDVKEIEGDYIKGVEFHYVKTMQQVVDIALV